MNKFTLIDEGQIEEVSQLLKVLADPNRLRIFTVLIQGDSCNARLNELLGIPPNLLSHHLKTLREAGLIRDRRDELDARWIYYTVDRKALSNWHSWLNTFFDPERLNQQPEVCGPEGGMASGLHVSLEEVS